MKFMTSLMKSALVIVMSVVAAATPLAKAETKPVIDEGWLTSTPQDVLGRQAVTMMDTADSREMASTLRSYRSRSEGRYKVCGSLTDANCSGAEVFEFSSILQPCASGDSLNCVAGFGVVRPDGTRIPATFERSFPKVALNQFSADDERLLPVGGPGALWVVPATEGMTHSTHYVRATVIGSVKPGKKAEYTDFAANINAVTLTTKTCGRYVDWSKIPVSSKVDNPCTPGDYTETAGPTAGMAGFVENLGGDVGLDCIMSGNPNYDTGLAECAYRRNLPMDVSYYLNVRLAQSIQGWMHGRLTDPDVSISAVEGAPNAVSISVAGKPVRVPIVHKELYYADLPSELKMKYVKNGGWQNKNGESGRASNWGLDDIDPADPTKRNRNSNPPPYGPNGIEELEAWMPFLKDTSTADRSTWSLRSLSDWERGQADSCLTDKTRVTGLVLTNATQYLAGAPAYNKETNSLDYKVAAPHYMSNGEVFKGSYQLIVRSDVAKCIYKFGGTAISASVEVVESATGESSTAVTSVSEKDGWLRISATGYTHSTPTIRAKFVEKTVPLKVKKTVKGLTLAKFAGVVTTKSSKVTVSVAGESRRRCRASGSSVIGLSRGSCKVTVLVTTGKKKSKQVVTVSVS